MLKSTLKNWTSLCFLALTLMLVGCESGSPEEKIAKVRAQYTVKLESFTVEEPLEEKVATEQAEEEATAVAGEAASAATAEEAAEGEFAEETMEEEEEASGPRLTDAVLHLLVRFNGEEALPGITVEVTQSGLSGKNKERNLQWVPTPDFKKNEVSQVDLKLEGVEFEDGDTFSVLLREVVPPETRSDYREFSEEGK